MITKSKTPWLTAKEEKRLAKIKSLIKRLEEGEHIQNRQLKTWLTEEQYGLMLTAWEYQKEIREDFKDKPWEIKEYERLLRKAIFAFNKANSGRFKKGGKQLGNEAEGYFESALEHIQGEVSLKPDLLMWLDIYPDNHPETEKALGTSISLEPGAMPQVITSRSLDNTTGIPVQTIREVKIDALKEAAEQLETKPLTKEESIRRQTRIRELLKGMNKEEII